MNYNRPTPETAAFMALITDSEIDLGQVEAKLKTLEAERDHARERPLTGKQLLEALELCTGDMAMTIGFVEREAFTSTDGDLMPAGLYAYFHEDPQEGLFGPLGEGNERCHHCNGKGKVRLARGGNDISCAVCFGTGKEGVRGPLPSDRCVHGTLAPSCPDCH